jgi:hypothetical protein
MKASMAIIVEMATGIALAITPLLGPAWTKPLSPAWTEPLPPAWTEPLAPAWTEPLAPEGFSSSVSFQSGTSILAHQNQSGKTQNTMRQAWIIGTTLVDSNLNILSDDNSMDTVYTKEFEAKTKYQSLCMSMESNGWRMLKEGVYEKENVICNVFIKMIYIYNN